MVNYANKTFANLVKERLEDRAKEIEIRSAQMRGEELVREEDRRKMYEDREPLSPANWIDNEYFSGSIARDTYPVLKKHFVDIYEKNIYEIYFAGAIGYGKTSIVCALEIYSLYLLSCFGVPQKKFRGMMENAGILLLNLNTTKTKAKNSYFNLLRTTIDTIPYFKNEFQFQKNLVNEVRFNSKNIICTYSGATKTSAESENLIFVALDEPNLYDIVDDSRRADKDDDRYDAAETVFSSAVRRMQTRFMLPDGSMPSPCKIVCLSRETYPDSFMRRRIRYVRESGMVEKGRAIVIEHSEWETKPAKTYDPGVFWITTGSRTESPEVIESKEQMDGLKASLEKRKMNSIDEDVPEIIEVPLAGGEYLRSAMLNPADFLREVCGRATESLRAFFQKKEKIYSAVRRDTDAALHPFSAVTMNFYDGVFLIKERLVKLLNGENVPIVNPDAYRCIHVDAGLTGDACGFVMGHIAGWKPVVRFVEGGAVTTDKAPIIWFDLVLRITPPPGKEIPFAGIRGLVYTLADLGFKIDKVTYDSFQRVWAQDLERRGFTCEILSVDKTIDPYVTLRQAYLEDRISTYEYKPLEEELLGLELIRTGAIRDGRPVEKVDHRPKASKDVADAAAGVAYSLETGIGKLEDASIIAKRPGEPTEAEQYLEKVNAFEKGNYEKLYRIIEEPDDR